MFVGLETLYKPNGFPSFELISYLLDSDLANIRKVLNDDNITSERTLACGDLKEIYSAKNFRQTETVRVANEQANSAQ